MKMLSECIFGKECELCNYFDNKGTCYCWLVLVVGALILLIMIITILLIIGKIKNDKFEEDMETENYIRTYNELANKKADEVRRQQQYEAKMNDEDGSEDILVQLVKEISEEERINLEEIQFEAATEDDVVTDEFQVNFKKQKDQEENK